MRAIAILWVMLFHMRFAPHGLRNFVSHTGWMGVDLFFVLSGYLIGSQLLRPYTKGSVPSVGGFYLRRAFRVLPAYLAVLSLYFVLPVFREAPGISPLWQFLTFTENFRIDYFNDQAFSHVWSLCVEEHFYLVLPLLVLVLMRRPRFGTAVAVICGVLTLGLAVRYYIYVHQLRPTIDTDSFTTLYVEKIYYPTYTRLDGLLFGVVLAAIKTFRPVWWQRAMGHGHALTLAGAATCAAAFWLFRDRFSFAGTVAGFPLMSLGLALLVCASISPTSFLSKARGFGWIATLAYSLYLTHKEVVHLDARYFPWLTQGSGWPAMIVYFATSFAVAAVLYFLIERPFLKMRERIASRNTRPSLETSAAAAQ